MDEIRSRLTKSLFARVRSRLTITCCVRAQDYMRFKAIPAEQRYKVMAGPGKDAGIVAALDTFGVPED